MWEQRKLGMLEAWLRSHASPAFQAGGPPQGKAVPGRRARWERLMARIHRATARWCRDGDCPCHEAGIEFCLENQLWR